jgi:hypothetical protein
MERKPGLDFNAFVLSLGSSALIHLGEAPDPESGKTLEPDLVLAQGSIDLLALLEEKTKGNLTPDESRFLQTMLYDLRRRFVSAKAHPKPKITPPPAGEQK